MLFSVQFSCVCAQIDPRRAACICSIIAASEHDSAASCSTATTHPFLLARFPDAAGLALVAPVGAAEHHRQLSNRHLALSPSPRLNGTYCYVSAPQRRGFSRPERRDRDHSECSNWQGTQAGEADGRARRLLRFACGVDGKVYIASEHGKVVVLRAAGDWKSWRSTTLIRTFLQLRPSAKARCTFELKRALCHWVVELTLAGSRIAIAPCLGLATRT